MYIPEFNRIEESEVSLAFMKANPFATLVSTSGNGPVATHLPLLIRQAGDDLISGGHFAKGNQQWSMIEEKDALVIFHGPHAYISPRLYEVPESVPTWNYAAVHVYGNGKLLKDDQEAKQILIDLISQFDPSYYQQWLRLDVDYLDKMIRRIVAFEIKATCVETKFKLSQDRTKEEQHNLIRALGQSSDSNVAAIAALMRQRKLGHFSE